MNVFKTINGKRYARQTTYQECFWKICKWLEDGDTPQDTAGVPHIVCECGNDKFILSYGSYELAAKCSECGIEETVYDG